jgi:hypothetical protein
VERTAVTHLFNVGYDDDGDDGGDKDDDDNISWRKVKGRTRNNVVQSEALANV